MSRRRKQNRHDLLLEKTVATKLRAAPPPAAINPTPAIRPASSSPAPSITPEQAAARIRVQIFELSRSVGNTIASEELQGGSSVQALVNGARKVAVYADQMILTINDRYHPALDCKAGCSYCCRKPGVLVSVPELLRILEHVRETFSETETAELAERARIYTAQMEGRDCNAPVDETVPCPLLVDEQCSVYDVRPLVCRGYNSTNVEACRAAHDKSNILVPIFAPIKDATDGATVGLEQQLKSQGLNDSMLDLGRSLNIAFNTSEDIEKSIAESGSTLAVAENKVWATNLLSQVREAARRVGIEM